MDSQQERTIRAFDQSQLDNELTGTAYYRLPKEVKEFLEKCLEKYEIVGFEWTEGSWNFGVMLAEKNQKSEEVCIQCPYDHSWGRKCSKCRK